MIRRSIETCYTALLISKISESVLMLYVASKEKKKEANKPKTESEPDVPRLESLEPEKLARV